MANDLVWLILLGPGGDAIGRVPIRWTVRYALPLRRVAKEGLGRGAMAVIIVRSAADDRCTPGDGELQAIETARAILHPLGLRLHDYILWHGDRCVSLKLAGRL